MSCPLCSLPLPAPQQPAEDPPPELYPMAVGEDGASHDVYDEIDFNAPIGKICFAPSLPLVCGLTYYRRSAAGTFLDSLRLSDAQLHALRNIPMTFFYLRARYSVASHPARPHPVHLTPVSLMPAQ